MKKYLIVIERTGTGYSAYSPDLPGCIATGKDQGATQREMAAAIQFHLEGLREDGYEVPEPRSVPAWIEIPA
jgi:predicted RNase H-like HicB family nuclease